MKYFVIFLCSIETVCKSLLQGWLNPFLLLNTKKPPQPPLIPGVFPISFCDYCDYSVSVYNGEIIDFDDITRQEIPDTSEPMPTKKAKLVNYILGALWHSNFVHFVIVEPED